MSCPGHWDAAHLTVHLGGQDDLVSLDLGQRLADDLLGLAERVDVGRVDGLMPGLERPVDDADRLIVIGGSPGPEHHGSHAEWADLQAGAAECSVFHDQRVAMDLLRESGRRIRRCSQQHRFTRTGMATQRRFGDLDGVLVARRRRWSINSSPGDGVAVP